MYFPEKKLYARATCRVHFKIAHYTLSLNGETEILLYYKFDMPA
jgi:hypothetical protein